MPSPLFPTQTSTPTKVVEALKAGANAQFQTLMRNYMRWYNLTWRHPTHAAADIVAAMGTEAAAIFGASYRLAQYLNGEVADAVPATIPDTYTATYNPDGSITITAKE